MQINRIFIIAMQILILIAGTICALKYDWFGYKPTQAFLIGIITMFAIMKVEETANG